jgi:hypothetical protein
MEKYHFFFRQGKSYFNEPTRRRQELRRAIIMVLFSGDFAE